MLSRKEPKDELEDTPREVEREEKHKVTAAEIDSAQVYGEAAIGCQAAEVRRCAMVIVCRKPLISLRRREHGMKDLSFQLLGKHQIDSGEDGVSRGEKDQGLATRLENAGNSANRRLRILDMLEERLANHKIGLPLAARTLA